MITRSQALRAGNSLCPLRGNSRQSRSGYYATEDQKHRGRGNTAGDGQIRNSRHGGRDHRRGQALRLHLWRGIHCDSPTGDARDVVRNRIDQQDIHRDACLLCASDGRSFTIRQDKQISCRRCKGVRLATSAFSISARTRRADFHCRCRTISRTTRSCCNISRTGGPRIPRERVGRIPTSASERSA